MKILPDIIAVIGAVIICFGVSLIYVPAAVILAGLFICLISFSLFKAGK
jgi:hypothetical protein